MKTIKLIYDADTQAYEPYGNKDLEVLRSLTGLKNPSFKKEEWQAFWSHTAKHWGYNVELL